MYCHDPAGIRVASEKTVVSQNPQEGIARIALFGDSFTHGDGVLFDQTWGALLQENLREKGINAEVLNFGVGGYGMDQAFLRWEKDGKRYQPGIVVFGLQPENIKRNLNIIRQLYFLSSVSPFTKPRFVLKEDNSLELINVPPLRPERVVDTMKEIDSWDLAEYEHWYKPEDFEAKVWARSKLVSVILFAINKIKGKALREQEKEFFLADGEASRLALKMLKAFSSRVEDAGADFVVVHLPRKKDLGKLLRGERLPYAEFLRRLEQEVPVVFPDSGLLSAAREYGIDSLFVKGGHYSQEANEIIAGALSEYIETSLKLLERKGIQA